MENTAKSIVNKLVENGFESYFVGGWVRDKLLGKAANDIDIATSASPKKIQELFEHTIPVGEAFGVIVVMLNEYKFEVATFRSDGVYNDGRRPVDVIYETSAAHDAARRDFTINGIFYDPISEKIMDYVGGIEDLKTGIVRAIGDPHERFKEDSLRMLRAVRYVTRYGFTLDSETAIAIKTHASRLSVSMERIWAEFVKMSEGPNYGNALFLLGELGLLEVIFKGFKYEPCEASAIGCLPAIIGLMMIYPTTKATKICEHLKVSKDTSRIALLYETIRNAKNYSSYEWAKFYALPDADKIIGYYGITQGPGYFEEHANRQYMLAENIRRIRERDPIVTSQILATKGIKPGPKMGMLLKTAEEISANEGIYSIEAILEKMNGALAG